MEDYAMADQQREVLVVASKVKAYIKSNDMMTSSEAIEAISAEVYALLDRAIARAKSNRRSTVKAQDL
jgi:sulfur transfer complex TusBCD TusB component (DsrH family)